MPHKSSTAQRCRAVMISAGESRDITPRLEGFFLAIRTATLARVFVGASPMDTGMPVHCSTLEHSARALSSTAGPSRVRNASSMEYISMSSASGLMVSITLRDISPYRAKLDEKTCTPCRSKRSAHLKAGAPILIPMAFDSLLRAITHPSLFDSTTTGESLS